MKKPIHLRLGREHLFFKYSSQMFRHGDGASGEVNIFVIFKCRSLQSWMLNSTFYLQLACYIVFGLDSYNQFWIDLMEGSSVVQQVADTLLWPESGKSQEIYRLSLKGTGIFSTHTKFNTVFSKFHSITINFLPFFTGETQQIRRNN